MPLKLTRRHGSPCWYIRGSIRGVRVDESTGLGERKAAEEVLIKRGAEIQHRTIHGNSATRTFGEAALSYMEAGGEREFLTPILKLVGRKKLGAVGQALIDETAAKLFPNGSNSTRNRKVYTPMVAVMHHAARKQWCSKIVVARPEQPKGRVRWITYEEAERLISSAAPHLRPLVIFLLSTGARISEALYLDWRQVDLDRAHVIFLDTKNEEDRGVPLHPRVVAELRKSNRREGAVFVTDSGEPYERREDEDGKVTGGGMVSTAWGTMCDRAKITDFTPHDCRHTWATWHYRQNRDLLALMQLGGWKTISMVVRYAHVNTEQLAPSINRVWGKCGELELAPENPSSASAA